MDFHHSSKVDSNQSLSTAINSHGFQLKIYGVPQGSVLGDRSSSFCTPLDVISIAASLSTLGVGAYVLCRRQSTVCRSQIGQVHRKSRGLDEVESAEAELRQDSIHVDGSRQQLAKIDTKTMTIGEHSFESSNSAKNLGVDIRQ